MSESVHGVAFAGQPDVQRRCDRSWSQPKWGGAKTPTALVYRSDADREAPQCPRKAWPGVGDAMSTPDVVACVFFLVFGLVVRLTAPPAPIYVFVAYGSLVAAIYFGVSAWRGSLR